MKKEKFANRISLSRFIKKIYKENLRDYLVVEKPTTRSERLTFIASNIKKYISEQVGIEIKYPFGSRSKRLEIVFMLKCSIFLLKLSSVNKLDQDGFMLDEVINHIKDKKIHDSVIGILLYEGSLSDGQLNIYTDMFDNDIKIFEIKYSDEGGINKWHI